MMSTGPNIVCVTTTGVMRIDIKNLSVSLSNKAVLRDITIHIPSGASAVIVGRSGSGKTTLLRSVAGLIQPSSGKVTIDGKQPNVFYGKGMMSYLFQEPYLWKHLTVGQSLSLTLRLHGHPDNAALIEECLERVGLLSASSLYPYQLSVGMKARAAIARAFCIPPQVLLMDEPFAAIDPLRRLDLNRQVQALRQEYGSTTLWATHDIVEALQFATHVIAMAPPPGGKASVLDLTGMPPIADNASLPAKALRLRDELLSIIENGSTDRVTEYAIESF